MSKKKALSTEAREGLLATLKARFEKHTERHKGIKWSDVQARLEAHPDKLWSLDQMELTEGEPDVVGYDEQTGAYIFFDCSEESPKGRRNTCFDLKGLQSRKEHQPEHNAVDMAADMGIELLTEDEYRHYRRLESSIQRPPAGSSRPIRSGNWEAPCFAIVVTTTSSPTIMVRKVTMPHVGFGQV